MPNEEEKCPCDAVRELKVMISDQEKRLNAGSTHFAVINTKLNALIAGIGIVGVSIAGVVIPLMFK